jgi:Ras family
MEALPDDVLAAVLCHAISDPRKNAPQTRRLAFQQARKLVEYAHVSRQWRRAALSVGVWRELCEVCCDNVASTFFPDFPSSFHVDDTVDELNSSEYSPFFARFAEFYGRVSARRVWTSTPADLRRLEEVAGNVRAGDAEVLERLIEKHGSEGIEVYPCFVGPQCGKSALLCSWTQNRFPKDYIPPVFDAWTGAMMLGRKRDQLCIWMSLIDTISSRGEYGEHRPAAYQYADVLVLCYDASDLSSLHDLEDRFVPEIEAWEHDRRSTKRRKKDPPFKSLVIAVLALRTDLRDDAASCRADDFASRLHAAGFDKNVAERCQQQRVSGDAEKVSVSFERGLAFAKRHGAIFFGEVSALAATGPSTLQFSATKEAVNEHLKETMMGLFFATALHKLRLLEAESAEGKTQAGHRRCSLQ